MYQYHIILIYLSFVAYSFLVPCKDVDFEFRPRGKILDLELEEKFEFLYRCICYVFGDRNAIALTIGIQQ